MPRSLVVAAVGLGLLGCTLKLPEIPPNHPANAGAPAGQTYASPVVLEVQPIVRPPDRPTTRPAHPLAHESEHQGPMDPGPGEHGGMKGHERGGMNDPADTQPATTRDAHSHREGKGQQDMQREGQRHE